MAEEYETIKIPKSIQLIPSRWFWDCPVCNERQAVFAVSSGEHPGIVECVCCSKQYRVAKK